MPRCSSYTTSTSVRCRPCFYAAAGILFPTLRTFLSAGARHRVSLRPKRPFLTRRERCSYRYLRDVHRIGAAGHQIGMKQNPITADSNRTEISTPESIRYMVILVISEIKYLTSRNCMYLERKHALHT